MIQDIIVACEWSTSHFLIFSGNVFSPLLYYSYFGSVIPSLIIGLYVFYKGPKYLANRLLLFTVLSFAAWVFCALVTWATEIPSYTMFFWSALNIFEPVVYFFSFYFFYVLTFSKDLSTKQKILFGLPLLITFLLTPTRFGLLGYNLSDCERNAVEGIIATYGYAVEIAYTFLVLGFALHFLNKTKGTSERLQTILLTTGIIAFLLSFSAGNILEVFTENWHIGQYGLFGAPVFVGFLAYIIVRYKKFNIKIFGTQVLVVAIGVLIGSMFFVRQIENLRFVLVGTIILFIPLAYLLVRSVRGEIESREKILRQKVEMEIINLKLQSINKKLKELDKQKTEFVSFASHQLRGPLTAIKGYASLILEGDYGKITDDLRGSIKIIFDSTNTLATVVDDYLNVSRIELGEMKYSFSVFDLKDLVDTSLSELKPNLEKAGLQLDFISKPENQYEVRADKEKLKQVLLNLIDNSIKYTPKGKITVSIESTNKKVKVLIKDTGIGISKEVIPKLFSKFKRADNANKTNMRGTGLGLFIAKEIITAHGGNIWVESEGEGRGSQFVIELDLHKKP